MQKTKYLIFFLSLFFVWTIQAETSGQLKTQINTFSKKEWKQQKKLQKRKERLQKLQDRIGKVIQKKVEKRKKRTTQQSDMGDFWYNFLAVLISIALIGGLFLLAFFTEGAIQTIAIVLLVLLGAYIVFGLLILSLIVRALK